MIKTTNELNEKFADIAHQLTQEGYDGPKLKTIWNGLNNNLSYLQGRMDSAMDVGNLNEIIDLIKKYNRELEIILRANEHEEPRGRSIHRN